MALDRFADRHGLSIAQKKFQGLYDSGFAANQKVHLLEPQTFMNLSGKSVAAAASFFDIDVDHIIVLHDEIDLPLGEIRVKIGGGHGGHNGLRDIHKLLGTGDYIRIRCGVGRPTRGAVTDHVLGVFRQDEVDTLSEMLDIAANALEAVIKDGATAAQNAFN